MPWGDRGRRIMPGSILVTLVKVVVQGGSKFKLRVYQRKIAELTESEGNRLDSAIEE